MGHFMTCKENLLEPISGRLVQFPTSVETLPEVSNWVDTVSQSEALIHTLE